MADTYTYRARDRSGDLVSGELIADTQQLALGRLRELEYIPLDVRVRRQGLRREIRLRPGRVKLKHLAVFSRQFATMVNSGLPLLRALSILEAQTPSKELSRVVGEIRVQVEKGMSLSDAMEEHPRTFPKLYVAMVRAGEVGGALDAVLLRLAENLEKEVTLRQKVKSAMTYPTVVLSLVILILVAMLLFVVPTFKSLYASLGGTLPLPTRILLAVSEGFRKYFVIVVAVVAVAIWLFRRWIRTENGRFRFDRFKLRLPIFGELFRKTAMSRFSRTLGTLTRSGVPILQSLEIVADTVNNAVVARAIAEVQERVKKGESLALPLGRHEVFPPMVVQMMAVGEETGALDSMLQKISDFYDDEVAATVEALTSIIEPIMVAVVGGAVGLIVISLYLPMFKIFELIK